MKILGIDTALGACSAAIMDGDRILAHRFEIMQRGHAEALAPMVATAITEAGISFQELERLAVTTGPGTFTGQRVGLAFMRGLRLALQRPLIGVTTLAAMARQALAECGGSTAVALHDARRDEVYLEAVGEQELGASVHAFNEAIALISSLRGPIVLAGTAAKRAQAELVGATLSNVLQPDALWVARMGQSLSPPASTPKPLYLRAPDAKLPVRG